MTGTASPIPAPLGLLAELTHRCPLQCPYCSNPLALVRRSDELDTGTWQRVLSEAASLGILHVHLSGGEPAVRKDLEAIVRHCRDNGLYTNLITSGVALTRDRLGALAEAGLDHVQLSVQGPAPAINDRVAGLDDAYAMKMRAAEWVRALGLPLTLNAVIHRANIDYVADMIDLAVGLGARRVEVAHVQYYGWALRNRAALMPTRAQVDAAMRVVAEKRERLKGVLVIDAVVPDYYARYPKPCMGGWGRQSLNVTPSGTVLPCHAAETIGALRFPNVREASLEEIWHRSPAFAAFRGVGWMPEPCRSCERKEIDWGGCRCQALAFTGRAEATDPACHKSPFHQAMLDAAAADAAANASFVYRSFANAEPVPRPRVPAD